MMNEGPGDGTRVDGKRRIGVESRHTGSTMKNCAGGDSCVPSDMKLPDGWTDGRKERMVVLFVRERVLALCYYIFLPSSFLFSFLRVLEKRIGVRDSALPTREKE